MTSAYLLAYCKENEQFFLVLGVKNIFGVKLGGVRQDKPIIWNSCGRGVIPGGRIQDDIPTNDAEKNKFVINNAFREFYEETGIDLDQRWYQDKPWAKIFDLDDGQFGCAYQRITNLEALVRAANANICPISARDDELHELRVVPAAESLNFIADNEMTEWKRNQFDALSELNQKTAIEKSRMKSNWFRTAIKYLIEGNVTGSQVPSTSQGSHDPWLAIGEQKRQAKGKSGNY